MPSIVLIFGLIVLWMAPQVRAQGPEALFQEGKKLFENTCADCHRVNGQGLPDKFPALDKNPFVVGDPFEGDRYGASRAQREIGPDADLEGHV